MASRASMRSNALARARSVSVMGRLQGCALRVTGIIRLTGAESWSEAEGAMGELAPGLAQNLWVTAAVLLACVLLLWLLSIRLRDISIIDIFWGPAFGIVALVGYALVRRPRCRAAQYARYGTHCPLGRPARRLPLLAQCRQR